MIRATVVFEDAKGKATTMRTLWVPGVNRLGIYGRWAFAELTSVYDIESDFKQLIERLVQQGTV
ncbi:MAG: hypothetical protein RMI89_02975 [Gloeomargarita sp. SKYBB_i_bin120]|nr:hypothetical protein [Gloeomargarita sp. SKYG98]MCS7291924.1 hypothetical protein [Gloeomargarita sp. SKYB120]MDW8177484.1 hypothetical protein [Gloeomargarita sp. SKYBB_i_bin120]